LNISFPFAGEVFSLCSAVFWAFAVVMLKKTGEKIHPVSLNLFKNTLGATLICITLILIGQPLMKPDFVTREDYIRLVVSGVIGIGLADIIFLHSLNIIGAGISALVDTVYSPFVIIFAYLMLGEQLTPLQFLGGALIIGAIIFASQKLQHIPVDRSRLKYGILLSIMAIGMMAFGIVLMKPVLSKFQGDVGKQLWFAGFRMIPASIIPLLIFLYKSRTQNLIKPFLDKNVWGPLISGSVFATYLGISFWIIGMSLTKASSASILNQTATIFILIFARIFLGEPFTRRRVLAIFIAMLGALLVFIG
jgi:drug/metabolite transporter (DMT)-like permease